MKDSRRRSRSKMRSDTRRKRREWEVGREVTEGEEEAGGGGGKRSRISTLIELGVWAFINIGLGLLRYNRTLKYSAKSDNQYDIRIDVHIHKHIRIHIRTHTHVRTDIHRPT